MWRQRRPLFTGGLLLLIGFVAAFGLGNRALSRQSSLANDPSAQHLFLRSFANAAGQSRLTLSVALYGLGQLDLGGRGQMRTTDYLRYVHSGVITVVDQRTGGLPLEPLRLTLAEQRFCVDMGPGIARCSPAHAFSPAWYIGQYLLGGQVGNLHFTRTARSIGDRARIMLRLSGNGVLGCTPARAGAGTRHGYHWCRFGDLDAQEQKAAVTGDMVVDARTGLPLTFNAYSANTYGPIRETATFTYGGRFHLAVPHHAIRAPCFSWIPAVHCIELRRG